MVSSFTSSIDTQFPDVFLPNPIVNSNEYRELNQRVQPRNNVNTGAHVWCQEDQDLNVSLNNQLTGIPNPKTLVQPVIMPPIYDTTYWRPNDFMIPNNINSQPRQELYQNGYMYTNAEEPKFVKEKYVSFDQSNQFIPPNIQRQCVQYPNLANKSLFDNHVQIPPGQTLSSQYQNYVLDSSVDKSNGYFPNQIDVGLPTNYLPQYPGQAASKSKSYNENIFTSTLQPNVYTRSQVIQPDSVMSNLGISFTQPFLPTYSQMVANGGILFTELDPQLSRVNQICNNPESISESEIYDPRLTGYGASNRYFLDPVTSQARYMYDDVDLIRRNQFITRNALDFTDFGLQTGPQPNPREMKSNMEIRQLAQQSFLDNALNFRTELQERLMKKNSNREWQQKQSPIMRNQYTRGGSSAPSGGPSIYRGPRG